MIQRTLLFLSFLLCVHATTLAQNSSAFEVWNASPLTKLSSNTTDSVVVLFDTVGAVINCTIQCEVRTQFGPYTTRRLQMRIPSFTGPRQYTPTLGGASTYWQNFSKDSLCSCVDNSVNKVVITEWDPALKQLEGTFEFRCESRASTGGEILPYRIRAGSFRWGGSAKLVLESDPKDTVKIPQIVGSDTTFNLVITSKELGAIQDSVTIKIFDKTRTGSTVFVSAGMTDAAGKLTYPITLQRDAPAGDYEIKFYGTRGGSDSSDTNTVLIRYRNRIWEYKCIGITLLSFDAGEGQEWKPVTDGSSVVSARGTIMISDVIKVKGKVRIETASGAEKVFVDSGDVFIPTTGETGAPDDMLFTDIILGGDRNFSLPDCNGLFNVVRDSLVKGLSKKLPGGVEVGIEKFTIINRANAKGIDIEGKIKLGSGSRTGCDPIQDPTGNLDGEPARKAVTIGVALTTAGFESLRVKVENISATNYVCIKEISASIDNLNKTIGFAAKARFPVKGTELTAGFSSLWKSGTGSLNPSDMMLDSIAAEFELSECKLIPETPFCFKALKLSGSGFANRPPGGPFSIRAGVVINSFEQAIIDKAPWIRLLADSLAIAQFEGTLQYTHPLIFTGQIIARLLRIDKPFKEKPWQAEGSYTLTLDFNTGITANATANIGHLGGDDYFVSGTITERIYWNPMFGISGSASGTVRIPTPGTDLLEVPGVGTVLRFMKLSGWIPQTLGTGSLTTYLNQDDGFLLKGTIDVSVNPIDYIRSFGVMSLAVSCKNGNWDVNMQQSSVPVPSQHRKGDAVQVYPAQAIDTFMIDATVTRAFVMINSQTVAPSSVIVAPDGTEHTAPSADGTIEKFSTPGGEMVQWTLTSPAVGAWVLRLTNPQAGDEVEIMANRATRAFAISVTSVAREFIATWDNTGASNSGDVRFFLDNDGKGLDGAYIGKIQDQAGTFTYAIPAELTECRYFVYAVRSAPGESDVTDYADDAVSTGNSVVPVPVSVTAVSNQAGSMVVTWRVPPGSTVSGFMVYAIGADNGETLVATASSDERSVAFTLADHQTKRIAVRAFDELGRRSCLTDAISITTDVDEQITEQRSTNGSIFVMPNPTTGATTIRYEIDGALIADVEIFDVVGNVVARISAQPIEVMWDASTVPSGTYFVRMHSSNGDVVGKILVVR